jgi:DNA-binding Xre family transcriptional regulator
MIIYDRLWAYMNIMGISQYKLLKSGISHSTLNRLKKNESVNIETIDKLCHILDCKVEDILEYVPSD